MNNKYDFITQILKSTGDWMLAADLYKKLLDECGNNRHKAAGSIGGAVRHGYIFFDTQRNGYVCTRDAFYPDDPD